MHTYENHCICRFSKQQIKYQTSSHVTKNWLQNGGFYCKSGHVYYQAILETSRILKGEISCNKLFAVSEASWSHISNTEVWNFSCNEIAEISQLSIQDWSHDSINQWSTISRPFIGRRRKSKLTVEPENGLFNYKKKAKLMPKTNGMQNKRNRTVETIYCPISTSSVYMV